MAFRGRSVSRCRRHRDRTSGSSPMGERAAAIGPRPTLRIAAPCRKADAEFGNTAHVAERRVVKAGRRWVAGAAMPGSGCRRGWPGTGRGTLGGGPDGSGRIGTGGRTPVRAALETIRPAALTVEALVDASVVAPRTGEPVLPIGRALLEIEDARRRRSPGSLSMLSTLPRMADGRSSAGLATSPFMTSEYPRSGPSPKADRHGGPCNRSNGRR